MITFGENRSVATDCRRRFAIHHAVFQRQRRRVFAANRQVASCLQVADVRSSHPDLRLARVTSQPTTFRRLFHAGYLHAESV